MTRPFRELLPEEVRRLCDPAGFDFETTASLPALDEVLGQPRALAALEFGSGIASPGFNLFALGLPGSGKTTLAREYLERRAAHQPPPQDLCYVYNFANARRPIPLRLPAGRALDLQRSVDALVEELRAAIPRAFDSSEYTAHHDKVIQDLEEKRREEITRLEKRVTEAGFQLLKGPGGLLLVPSVGGKPLTEQDLESLKPEDREKVARVRDKLQHEIEERLGAIREIEKGARDALRSLDVETAAFAIRHLVDELRARFRDQAGVLAYLDAFEHDVIAHADDFRKGKEAGEAPVPVLFAPAVPERTFARYQVNVLVDNSGRAGAPVVVESNPTYHNLIGRIEHQATWGGVFTDHTMIKPGALHRANGGYLLIPARECLLHPFAWEGLKRALKDRALRIEELGAQLSLVSSVTLDPEPVPLDVKVVLIGSPMLYYLLQAYDEDFQKLFKVKADFTSRMDRTPEAERAYASFIAAIARQDGTLPFDRGAVARVVEFGSRVADDQERLSTRFGEIADLIREASHRAGGNSHAAVTAGDVRAAEEARRYRGNLLEERLRESIRDGTVLIETSGSAVGRINGLSVLSLGDTLLGQPSRITAAVGPGRRGVVSIEREVELSGPIHGKGVLILGGYLTRRYGQSGPLSLSASLVFEQSYGMVEGDSASLAELLVLVSAVSGIPLRQDIAVTGSVNQYGEVQAIGGASEKVEGFFEVCRARGLTGSQGVLIPESNRRHLMLRDEVVDAIRARRFHVWTAGTVDAAAELLTGLPPEQVHDAVSACLARYAEVLKSLAGAEERSQEMQRR